MLGNSEKDEGFSKYKNKIRDLFGNSQEAQTTSVNQGGSGYKSVIDNLNPYVGDSGYKSVIDNLNPYVDDKGNLKNPYLDYQSLINSNNINPQAKQWMKQATGLKESDTNPQNSTTQSTSSSAGQKIVQDAEKYLGTNYVWGGETPDGFDCSGLVQYVCAENGISVPRTTYEQINSGTAVSKESLQPGDLVFFGSSSSPHHVGIYVGNGQYLHAPKTGDVVKISDLGARSDFAGARRVTK